MKKIIKVLSEINKHDTLDSTDHEVINDIINQLKLAKTFPNGFTSWQETHFHIVSAIARTPDDAYNKVTHIEAMRGQGGLWELAEELTDKFEQKHKGVEWDGEYFDTIDAFLEEELKTN